jgi:uncharacterized protein YfiM (DUF2279 family)
MRAAVILALVLVTSAHADEWTGADKSKHFMAGAAVAGSVTAITGKPWQGFAAGAIVGALKEASDWRSAGHTVSGKDFAVTALGAAAAAYTGGLIITYRQGHTGVAIQREF